MNATTIYNILLIIAGLFIRYQVGRRRFNRRSTAGVQLYRNYFVAVVTTIGERIANILGALLIIVAILKILLG